MPAEIPALGARRSSGLVRATVRSSRRRRSGRPLGSQRGAASAPRPVGSSASTRRPRAGGGRVVVGCVLGGDAEYLARLGFATVGFDFAATAIRTVRERFPASPVEYH